VALAMLSIGASAAAAHRPQTCSGSAQAPGVLEGSIQSNATVEGFCVVNAGPATVAGNLTVRPGAVLAAAFALNDQTGNGNSSLSVGGNIRVQRGATLILGCTPQSFACLDDPNQAHPTLSSAASVGGNLDSHQPLGVVVHDATIGGNVSQNGGGGGLECEPTGIFATFHVPVYSTYEDGRVGGNLSVNGLTSCWLGMAREQVGGNLRVTGDQLADPDAIEIVSNTVGRNLICHGDSQVWDSADVTPEVLFPRASFPNTVNGKRIGQCLLASPTEEGGALGPGPF